MTLPLTPDILAAAYDYLRVTPPFSGWNLPESEDVKFKVSRRGAEFARYRWDGKQHVIEISQRGVGFTRTLIEKMAHEKIHLYLEIMGWESKDPSPNVHNAAFRKFSAQVCKVHGFDPKAFY